MDDGGDGDGNGGLGGGCGSLGDVDWYGRPLLSVPVSFTLESEATRATSIDLLAYLAPSGPKNPMRTESSLDCYQKRQKAVSSCCNCLSPQKLRGDIQLANQPFQRTT